MVMSRHFLVVVGIALSNDGTDALACEGPSNPETDGISDIFEDASDECFWAIP